MIPAMNIVAWANVAPWAEQRQIEQDLIISRAIINLFADDFLRDELRFRGGSGTALNKLHFPTPFRYSEDIDLARMFAKLSHGGFAGDIRPLLAPSEVGRLTDETMKTAFADVFTAFVTRIPGDPWARTQEMTERFDLVLDPPG